MYVLNQLLNYLFQRKYIFLPYVKPDLNMLLLRRNTAVVKMIQDVISFHVHTTRHEL